MTDRELLEKAAKAAGMEFDGEWSETDRMSVRSGGFWNPITDDGDALRLMVKLRLEVDAEHDPVCVGHYGRGIGVREPHGTDPCAATRRAIVRAAAAMVSE